MIVQVLTVGVILVSHKLGVTVRDYESNLTKSFGLLDRAVAVVACARFELNNKVTLIQGVMLTFESNVLVGIKADSVLFGSSNDDILDVT